MRVRTVVLLCVCMHVLCCYEYKCKCVAIHVCVRHVQQDKNVSAVWPFGEMRNINFVDGNFNGFHFKNYTQMYDLVTFIKL